MVDVPAEDYRLRVEPLLQPPLEAVAAALAAALAEDYSESSVEALPAPPDLREWGPLLQVGLSGSSTITDHGGEAFNHDPAYNQLVRFDMAKVASALGQPAASLLGAGACCADALPGGAAAGHWGELAMVANLAEVRQ